MNDNIPPSSNFHSAIPTAAPYHALPEKDKAAIQARLHFLNRYSDALGKIQQVWTIARQFRVLDELDRGHAQTLHEAGQVLCSLAEELSELADQKQAHQAK